MEVVIDWSSSCGYYSDTEKKMQQLVSEPSILGGERRLESWQSDAGITENRWEAHWRRVDARLDEVKKAILDLSFSTQGRYVETTDASSGSLESHVRAEAEHRSCSTDLDPTDCNLSPMQKTEEHKVRGIDSESYFLSFSHDSMNTIVGNSIGVSELSTMGDDSLIEQHSNIVEEESTMSLKDAIAIYVEEFVNSRNSSMKFDVAARASFDVKAEGLVDEEEKEVSKEVSMGESLCRCKGVDGKYVQMDRTFDAFLFLDPIKVPVSSQIELAKVPMTNKMRVQNPSKCGWSVPNWFAMPKVKMKTEKVGLGNLITASTQEFGEGIQLVEDAFVFLKGKITRVIVADSFFFHFGVDTGAEEILDHGKMNGIEWEQCVIVLFDNKTFSQAKEIKETKRLPIARRSASLRELAVTLNVVRNLTRLPVRYPKPLVKMKFMVVLIDRCRDFKGGGMAVVTHMHVHGEVTGGILGMQFDLDEGRLQSFSSQESQETKEIDLFMPLLHNWKTTKVNGTDSKLYILSFLDNSKSYSVGNSMGVSELSKFAYDGSVEHHSCCREEETYMGSKVDEFKSAGVARRLLIVSKSSGFANFLMEQVCSDGVDYDSLVYKSPEQFSFRVQSNIVGLVYWLEIHKVAKPQPSIVWDSISSMNGLNTKVLFSERNGTDQPTSLYDAAKRADYGLWGRLEMAYLFFTSDILKGNSIPIFEAATYETAAVGKSTGCGGKKRIHQLTDIGWLASVLFPKAKGKNEGMGRQAQEAWLHDSLWTRNLKGDGLLWSNCRRKIKALS